MIALGIIADQAILKRDSSDLKSRFQCWFLKMRARSLAKMCFQSHLLKRFVPIPIRLNTQHRIKLFNTSISILKKAPIGVFELAFTCALHLTSCVESLTSKILRQTSDVEHSRRTFDVNHLTSNAKCLTSYVLSGNLISLIPRYVTDSLTGKLAVLTRKV